MGLFRLAERQICQAEIVRVFKDVDDFLRTASSIMNRRKSRAGRSLENHVEYILKKSGIPHVIRPKIDGEPDIVIPSTEAYNDKSIRWRGMPRRDHSLRSLVREFATLGVSRVLIKELAPNDNSKNQIYVGRGFETLNLIPVSSVTPSEK